MAVVAVLTTHGSFVFVTSFYFRACSFAGEYLFANPSSNMIDSQGMFHITLIYLFDALF